MSSCPECKVYISVSKLIENDGKCPECEVQLITIPAPEPGTTAVPLPDDFQEEYPVGEFWGF